MVRFAAFALTLCLGTTLAHADSHLNCDAYAAASVAHQTQNMDLGCGFQGGRWSFDYMGHRNWCLLNTTTMANLTTEDRTRADALTACKTHAQACDSYATVALLQHRFNQISKCGLSGGAWSSNHAGHRAWCMQVALGASLAQTKARAAALGACQAGQDPAEVQKLTAEEQKAQNLLNSAMQSNGNDILKNAGG